MINNKGYEKAFRREVLLKVEEGHSREFASPTYHEQLEAEGFIVMTNKDWQLTPKGVREILPPEESTLPIPKMMFKTNYGKALRNIH
jgi:hypothetical protein